LQLRLGLCSVHKACVTQLERSTVDNACKQRLLLLLLLLLLWRELGSERALCLAALDVGVVHV
jgi:hypothetical protein